MYATLSTKRKLEKKVSLPKQLPLNQVNHYLSELDKLAEINKETPTIEIQLFEEDSRKFVDEYTLGEGNVRNIILLVSQTFEESFKDIPVDTKMDFLFQLEKEVLEVSPLEEFHPVTSKEPSTHRVRLNKKLVVGVLGFFSLLVLLVAVMPIFAKPSDEPKVVSLTSYLEQKDYDNAASTYHDEASMTKIMRQLAKEQETKTIFKLEKKYPTTIGKFYRAFYESDWSYVVENFPPRIQSEEKIMLGYAYVQLGFIQEAEVINQELKSKKLEKAIEQAQVLQAITLLQKGDLSEAEKLQETLNNPVLASLIEEAKTYIQLIELYEKQGDKTNQKKWEEVLSNLGEEENNDGETDKKATE